MSSEKYRFEEVSNFIYRITKEQMIQYRKEGYLDYLYSRVITLPSHPVLESDREMFKDFTQGKYDTNEEYYAVDMNTVVLSRMQNTIWHIANNFDDWDYQSFLREKRNDKIISIIDEVIND